MWHSVDHPPTTEDDDAVGFARPAPCLAGGSASAGEQVRFSQQGQREIGALDVADVALGLPMAALDPAHPGDLLLQRIILVGRLAGVGVAGRRLRGSVAGDVDVVGRRELHGVLAVRDLVVVEGESLLQPEPGVIDQHRDGPMIGVVVDRPVGEDRVGPLGLEDLAECLVMGRVDDRLAVELAGVERACLQDLAGLPGLGDAARARRPAAAIRPCSR